MRFKKHLSKNRWNYGTLAKAMGVSRVTVASWDNGKTSPNVDQTKQLIDLLGIEFEQLFERGEENERSNDQRNN